jgi:outer membrane protein TolC
METILAVCRMIHGKSLLFQPLYALLERYYKHGSISILEVLESRRNLLEINLRRIDLITENALLAADLMELTGISVQIIK